MTKKLFILIAIISFGILNVNSQNLNYKLFGHFPFAGNSNDMSTTNVNGTVSNATLTTGMFLDTNNAYLFNGSNASINLGTSNRNITDSINISCWVKTSNSGTGFILRKYDYSRGYMLFYNNGKISLSGRNGGSSSPYINTGLSSASIKDDKWHHVMAKIHKNNWELWIDCNLEATATSFTTSPSLINSESLTIGVNTLGTLDWFTGTIDEIRIYNRALSSAEIALLCDPSPPSYASINEKNIENDVLIYPNPTEDIFRINTKGKFIERVEIFNQLGQKILEKNSSNNMISISYLEKGVYFVRVYFKNSNKYVTNKIIKN